MVEKNMEKPMAKKKQGYIRKLQLTGQLNRFLIYLASIIPAVILIILAGVAFTPILNPIKIGGFSFGEWYDYLVLAIIISTAIYGIYEFLRLRRVRKIDDRFPDFIRDISESRRAGMTFTKAIMYSAKGNYGVLTSEIQKIARQISWGSSVDDALTAFSKRVNTKLIRRTISLVIEASRSGGNVADVLEAASRDAREIKHIESERRANLLSYVAVIYVGMGIFLMIIVVLSGMLLPQLTSTGAADMSTFSSSVSSQIKQSDVTPIYFWAAVIQSFGMGLVTGVFEEGSVIAGVKHIFIMVFLTWFVFKIFIGI